MELDGTGISEVVKMVASTMLDRSHNAIHDIIDVGVIPPCRAISKDGDGLSLIDQ